MFDFKVDYYDVVFGVWVGIGVFGGNEWDDVFYWGGLF